MTRTQVHELSVMKTDIHNFFSGLVSRVVWVLLVV